MLRPIHVAALAAACLASVTVAIAQTPIALPSAMTTLAGLSPMAATAGSQCPNLPAGVVSTDVYGDGCLAVNGIFGAAGRGGVAVDAFGNVFVADDVNNVIHMINASSGIMTKVAGAGSTCSTREDTSGDGCLAATQTAASSERGIGIDPWGNVLLPGYGDHLVRVICRTASPLCSPAQVGFSELVAGCVSTSLSGTTGTGSDNVQAAQTGIASCTAANGEVNTPRGVTADAYGNVYFAETATFRFRAVLGPQTSTYFSGTNPLWAALAVHYPSLTQGYAYTVVDIGGNTAATTKGNACTETTNSVVYSGTALDAFGDGCPLDFSSVSTGSSSYVQAVAADAAGNLVFADPGHGELRVFFVNGADTAGAAMAAAITANNPTITAPQPGFVYLLAGGGTTSISATPTLGSNTSGIDSSIFKITVSPQGNVFIGDSSKVEFFDINTGYIRTLFSGSSNVASGSFCSGSSGQTSLSAYSDGCPASKSLFTNSNGLGLAADAEDNLYLYDASSNTAGMLVRKVLAQGLAAQAVDTPLTQTFEVHVPEATAGTVAGAIAVLSSNPDITAAAPSCAQNADHSVDCSVAVTATPSAAGLRSAALTLALPSGSWENPDANISLGGIVTGSVLAVDDAATTLAGVTTPIAPTTNQIFSAIAPLGVALDGAGNVYAIDANSGSIFESAQGAAGVAISSILPTNPGQLAVDAQGDVFAAGSGTPQIEELKVSGAPASAGAPSTFTSTTISYATVSSATPAPQAVAVDTAGNLFVADNQGSPANNAVYRLSLEPGTPQTQVTVATGFSNPVSLAVDGKGNLFVADKGAGTVLKLAPGVTGSYAQTTLLGNIVPVAVAVDAAGDVYVEDESSASVIEIPAGGGAEVSVYTGLVAPTGLAVDGKGDVYVADSHNTGIVQVVRDALSYNFGTSEAITFSGSLTNAGNQAITGSNTVTNTTNFSVTGGGSNECPFTSSVLGALTAGASCTLSATLVGGGSGPVSDVLSFVPAASTVGSLTLTGTLEGIAIATTTALSGPSPSAPVFSPSGTEATFTVTVTAASGATAPGGTVAVTVDSTTTNPTLAASGTSGVATVTLSGLSAGTHTITAVYGTNGSFTGSSSGAPQSFTVAQIPTAVTWTPASASQQVSQAIGSSALDAAEAPAVAGSFVYTATPSGGSPIAIDASTYLPIGSYSLGVTFYPADSVDYASSTATAGAYTVTKASATAVVGASTNVVAADGSGNYTSLSAALAALPTTGGTIYLKPGTYTGQNAVSYPNVSLRGLGGDSTKVILTAEDGAFSAPFVYPGSGPGNANASGDQGSSTLDVTKSAFIGTQPTAGNVQFTPSNFYAEYLTIQNTYNTDTATTSTYSTQSGSCANTGVAQTLQALYNSGFQCNSQALALWIESDQAVLNNVNLTSQQDTLFAGSQGCGSTCTAARQYMWKGAITGDVDYVFGDAALVFDHTNFFTAWHGNSATGTETIEAQNKKFQTGSGNDYLSGYICNGCTLMSQSTGMTNLYFGRPYGTYSTWIMLNSFVDQVNPIGWIEFSGDTNLPTATYAEFNTQAFTDPAVGTPPYPATLFGGVVTPTGGNTGAGVTGTRETTSQDPGTLESENPIKTQLTAAQAAQYYPVTFLSTTVPAQSFSGFTANWNPTTALSSAVNAFASTGNITLNSFGESVTILGRPQTPGAGLIPTGAYQFLDGSTVIASGNLDASGEAYLTTSTLSTGVHTLTMVYSGDSNFNGSTSAAVTVTVPAAPLTPTTTALHVNNLSATYGGAISGSVTVAPQSGTGTPTGTVNFFSGTAMAGSCALTADSCSFSLTSVPAGVQSLTANYGGDGTYATSISGGVTVNVARAILNVAANNSTITIGAALPTYAAAINGFVNGDTQTSAITGSPTLTGSAANSNAAGTYPISVSLGTLAAANYNFTFTNGYLRILPVAQAAEVATGDTRTVTEPQFPAVCQQLSAAITMVNNDIPTSVDATVTNPDGARIQAALNSCAGTGQAVELSLDGAGDDAFLSGPLSMPSNVTLLVDPGVVLFFSRNVQDYDTTPGTPTCGTVNNNSATGSCRPLIEIPGSSTNVGVMGFGKLDGRGGDTLINAFPSSFAGQTWWGLSAIANSGGSQQNPRFIQMDTGASNITLYKITLRNSPLFHVSTTGAVSNFTAWDIKITTPTTSRNTDGIDPGNAQNITITRSWVSDGDDNVAVGAANSVPSANISVTNNHFFAGHGESIGSFTQAGVSNVLFDGNMLWGNESVDSNSTGLRIKSANDRGGVVTNIQYSNSCFQDHKAEIQFTPLYNTDTGTATPNFQNLLLQNLTFLTEGTVQFTGADNPTNNVINPLTVTLDNVNFNTLASSDFVTNGSEGNETNAQLTYGPGDVSSNFINGWATFAGSNGDTATNNITATSLFPPQCVFTAIAPELTGPAGVPQTITQGENATAVVILTPAVGGAAYPTGTVTLTDALTGNATTVTLPGSTDTLFVPLSGLPVGAHTFTATYSGDANYVPAAGAPYSTAGPYIVTVNAGSLTGTSTALSGVPATVSFGTPFTATATVAGSNATGTVEFVVNGSVFATAALGSGTASATISLPFSTSTYSIDAVYSGDIANAGSTSSVAQVMVTAAATTTALSANPTATTLGHPVTLSATVSSGAGIPTGTVTFSYTTSTSNTPVVVATGTLSSGTASAAADLPVGTDAVTATYAASGSFAGSASTPMTITVNLPAIIPLSNSPIALPYTMTTLAGGAPANCATAADKFGNGCPATSILLNGSVDLRSVDADPFGNVYFTDANASQVRRIGPNGIVTNFAGFVAGTACLPNATTTCVPTLVKLNKPRGLSTDALGNVYIAGYSDSKVYKVSVATGMLSLVAGSGTAGTPTASNGDGGPATAANLDQPRSVWADTLGDVYIADTADNKIREVNTTGTIQTIAGTGATASNGDGGPATAAAIDNPQGVLVDANLNVYVADSSKVRVICVTCGSNSPLDHLLAQLGITAPVNGDIYTIAGGGSASYAGPFPVISTTVGMSPQKLGIDLSGNIYISDGDGAVWFLDVRTANIRPIAGKATTNCATATDSFGDGCPATQAVIGDGGNGIGAGTDELGNLYISDTLNARIRKVTTNLASPATATASTVSQPVELHFVPGDSLASNNGLAFTSTEWSLNTPACTANGDTTSDCLLSSSFTPAVPGPRSTPLAVNSAAGNTANLALTGTGLGAGATLDPASQSSFGANLVVAGLTVDSAGNVYVSDSNSKQLLRYAAASVTQGASATGTTLATLAAPGAVAVDGRGFTYVADTSAGTVTQISPAGAATALPFTFAKPAGLAVDSLNNLYVSDSAAQTVYQISPITGAEATLALGTLVAPTGLAIDPQGNLLIADPGAPAIYRFNLESGVRSTVATTAVAPSAVLTDAAGNLLLADTASILAVPASSNSAAFTIASLAPSALAIDSAGNLYTGSAGGVLKLTRTQGSVQFANSSAPPASVNLLESGNQVYTATSIGQTDTSDYALTPTASTDCAITSAGTGTLAVGGVCTLTATYTPTTFLTTTDTATFNGNLANAALSTPSAVQLTLTGPATRPASMITLGAVSPASPVYGRSITVSATVTGTSIAPTGTVVFTVDGSNYSATVANGMTSAIVSGLNAGTHTLSAAYTSSNGYAASSTAPANFTVAQAASAITISANPNPALQGKTDVLTAAVTGVGALTGNVVFTSGATTLCTTPINASGVAACSFVPSASGTLAITAQYQGDLNHLGSSANLPLNVYDTSITLQFSSTQLVYPGATNVTVCVAGATKATPTGTIKIYDGTTLLTTLSLQGGGCAYWYISPGLSAGTHTITAVYSGDKNNPAGTSAPTVLTVSPVPVNMSVSCWNASFPYGANYQCTVNVSSNAGSAKGSVTYSFDGGATVAVPLSNGNAQFTITKPPAGNHSVVIAYAQQTNYAAAPAQTENFTVTPAPVIVLLTPSTWFTKVGTSITFNASVTSWSAGTPNDNGAVSFYNGSTLLATVPVNSTGQASYTTSSVPVGIDTITATYAGGTNYASGSTTVIIILTR
ncbi:MAG TPA: pectinesterase family protein [Terracidiphilus sp.]|jgi:sugar lactone lactonase YvrE